MLSDQRADAVHVALRERAGRARAHPAVIVALHHADRVAAPGMHRVTRPEAAALEDLDALGDEVGALDRPGGVVPMERHDVALVVLGDPVLGAQTPVDCVGILPVVGIVDG